MLGLQFGKVLKMFLFMSRYVHGSDGVKRHLKPFFSFSFFLAALVFFLYFHFSDAVILQRKRRETFA